MGEYFVHPKHSVILRGVQRRGGEKVKATHAEVADHSGKLLTEQEFEDVCIDLQAAAEDAEAKAGERFAVNLEAMRKGDEPKGEEPPRQITEESEE